MRSREYKVAFLVGVASSVLWFFVLKHLSLLNEEELVALVVALPFIFAGAIAAIAHFRHGKVFHKLVKFLMVGALNTGIDFFVFNTIIVATSIDKGTPIILFKSASFLCALLNSYELNRIWTFSDGNRVRRSKAEFFRFAVITVVGFLVNVGTTSILVGAVRPPLGLSQIRWDNVAAAAATGFNLIWNFIGYKLFVFESKDGKGRGEILPSNVI